MVHSARSRWLHQCVPGLFVVLAAGVMGCGDGSGTVSGTVAYKGAPLNSGSISFNAENGQSASGAIDADGKYMVTKVPLGPNKIVIRTPPPIPEKQVGKVPGSDANTPKPVQIPAEYGNLSSTTLTYTVKSGSQEYPIELK